MPAHERLTAAITAANDANRPALVPFITAGYPEPGEFINTLKAVAEVGDVVELGIPFSDPMADGMTIQRSSFEALQKGVSLKWIFDQLDSAKGQIDAPLVMMSYLNPLLAFGYDALAERALAAGVCGFIVPAAETTFSSNIVEPMSFTPLTREISATRGPCVTHEACRFRMLSKSASTTSLCE